MDKLKIKIIIDVLMLIDFIVVMITGFDRHLRQSHIVSAWILVGLIVLHLLLNFNQMKCMIANLFKRKDKCAS